MITPKIIEEARRRNLEAVTEQSVHRTPNREEGKIDSYLYRLESEPFPSDFKKKIKNEIRKFSRMNPWGSNRDIQEEYIEKLMSLPWWQTTPENQDLATAQAELDKGHFGLEKVKERILEYLAGRQRAGKKQSQVLCLVGPPGIGKTSLGQSIAKAMGRKFVKVSVGGIHDEGEIRGHRRTYIGAMPGKIIQGMKQAEVTNPLFLIDEVDKVINNVGGQHGNPTAALLEVLDPEQNEKFVDNYLGQDFSYDLSQVFFLCTANDLRQISAPLRDRMDIIQLPPYTTLDKIKIVKSHLIPKVLAEYKLEKDQLTFTDEAIEEIIRFYIYSGGIREPEKIFRKIARMFIVKQIINSLESERIDLTKLREYLGPQKISHEDLTDYSQSGVVNGLAWTEIGGTILPVEASCCPAEGKCGKLIEATGSLSKVMNESAKVAYRYVRNNYQAFGITKKTIEENDIFLHFPEGGIPKDGPSAGIAITTAIISALKEKVIPRSIAMTGEITSKGKVSAVGGLREKLTAAYEHKLKTIFIPLGNKNYLDDLPSQVKDKLEIIPADNYLQIWDKF